ncbi:hypothetical protein C9I49_22155 [Pseudomonas prosekii]|uniref:Uncharacterized protein n=1 Tax=Pseudomonas prosekii TaxID=1148509 RepID=A0A2U2D375_9PSED|nr:hypothetical protein C9I49_22155 [Pseudomonas prosekii]
MQKGVDAEKVFGRQEGKDPHTISSLSICWGFFVFGSTTSIPLSWECCWSRMYQSPQAGVTGFSIMPDRPESWAKFWEAMSNPLLQGAVMAILRPSSCWIRAPTR